MISKYLLPKLNSYFVQRSVTNHLTISSPPVGTANTRVNLVIHLCLLQLTFCLEFNTYYYYKLKWGRTVMNRFMLYISPIYKIINIHVYSKWYILLYYLQLFAGIKLKLSVVRTTTDLLLLVKAF